MTPKKWLSVWLGSRGLGSGRSRRRTSRGPRPTGCAVTLLPPGGDGENTVLLASWSLDEWLCYFSLLGRKFPVSSEKPRHLPFQRPAWMRWVWDVCSLAPYPGAEAEPGLSHRQIGGNSKFYTHWLFRRQPVTSELS